MKRQGLVLIFALLGTGCSMRVDPPVQLAETRAEPLDSGEGQLYMNALAEAVLRADRIVVTEHSNVNDVLESDTRQPPAGSYRPLIYNTHEFTTHERADFLHAVMIIDPKTQDAFAACVFEPHHSITFFKQGRMVSTLRVCFQCGQVELDGSDKTPPWALVPVLKDMIGKIGMKDERDWHALAKTAGS